MNGPVREAWAWLVSVAALAGGWLGDLNWLGILGVIIALLTAVERIYAIRVRRAQLRAADDQ